MIGREKTFRILLILNIIMILVLVNTNFTNAELRDISLGLTISSILVSIWYKFYYL
jgi:hypothetical protein